MTRILALPLSLLALALLVATTASAYDRNAGERTRTPILVAEPTPMPAGCGDYQCWCDRFRAGDCARIESLCDNELVCDYRGMCSCHSNVDDPIVFLD